MRRGVPTIGDGPYAIRLPARSGPQKGCPGGDAFCMVRPPARWALGALIATLALLVLASPAAARTEVRILGATEFQSAADQFLVPEPPGDVRVLLVACTAAPEASGCHTSGWRV